MTTTALAPTDPLADEDARRAIREDLDDTLVVEAAAGTGKTTELVTRIVRVLATGRATMGEVVAVTFTEKAAGELKLRLREAVEIERSLAGEGEARQRLEDALRSLEEAHVNTIHGFCAELLRERPAEAGVDPLFAVLTEPQAERLYGRAFHTWIQEALASPPEGVRRALRRTNAPWFGGEDAGPIERIRGAGWMLARLRDFTTPWVRQPFDRDAEVMRLTTGLHALADMSADGSERDNLFKSLDGVRRLSRQIRREQSLGQQDLDGWESRLIDLARDQGLAKPKKGYGAKYGVASRTEVLTACLGFHADLLEFRAAADADLAALLQSELQPAVDRYRHLKERQGALDFEDLLARTRDLLQTSPDVRRYLQQRFKRIFVDEFQDTDPVQAEILLLLAADNLTACDWTSIRPASGKLFIVGDPKQAIYRFRGADVGTYWRVRCQLEMAGGRIVQLTTNFRSVPDIQRFVNCAFREEMTADDRALQAEYVPLTERRPADAIQPGVIALAVPAPYSTGRPFNAVAPRAIEESLPEAIAAFVEWLLRESGWEVPEPQPDGTERRSPIRPEHVGILFRRFTGYAVDMTLPYIRAIEARGIPHLLVGGKTFHDREEVETIRAALAAIEWPDDELSVFATLKGSLFAIDDEHLLVYRDRFRTFHPYRIPRELGGNSGMELALTGEPHDFIRDLIPIADALRVLQELHRCRNYRPVADTLARLLAATRAHVGFVLRQGGEQALANVLHVAELARQYEANGGISFRGFIDELRHEAERTDTTQAPIVEEGSGGVRLMTVHKAKGLEFPVVILADPTCHLSRDDVTRYLDADRRLCAVKLGGWAPRDLHDHQVDEALRNRAEGVRIAYVAATRARDLLVVPAVGDEPWESGWLGPLNRALYPDMGRRQTPAGRGPGCPPLKSKDSVLIRPEDRMPDARTVAPGLHRFDEHTVVWWDPRWLTLGSKAVPGIRRQDLIVKEAPREVVAARRSAYESWRASCQAAREAGRVPALTVATAREVAREIDALNAGEPRVERHAITVEPRTLPPTVTLVTVESAPGPQRDRPRGPSFGLLVHAVLADVPLDAPPRFIAPIAESHARALGIPSEDAAAAALVVAGVLRHDLVARARAADERGRCRRETPVAFTRTNGTLVEGVVDLAFEVENGGRWILIDFKTDRDLGANEDQYIRQVELYAQGIRAATGKPVDAYILRI